MKWSRAHQIMRKREHVVYRDTIYDFIVELTAGYSYKTLTEPKPKLGHSAVLLDVSGHCTVRAPLEEVETLEEYRLRQQRREEAARREEQADAGGEAARP